MLPELPQRKILVISDRYPPNAQGGAELSLHLMLSASDRKADLLVVTFNEKAETGKLYQIDGIDVLELPSQAPWPLHRISFAAYRKIREGKWAWWRFIRLAWLTAIYMFLAWPLSRIQARSLAFDVQFVRKGDVRRIIDFDEQRTGFCRRMIHEVVRRVRPRLIHADNHRSILAVHDIPRRGLSIIGVVRDNRFHCARPDQSMMIGNRMCGLCDIECSEGIGKVPESRRILMRRTRLYRQDALRTMNRIVVTSQFLHNQIAQFINQAKLQRVSNGVDRLQMVLRSVSGVAERPGINILVVGMLNDSKGQEELVRHLPTLLEKVPDVTLHIAGRGEDTARKIEQLAKDLDISDRIVMHGYLGRAALFELYASVQIVALPTIWPEPFGRVPLEAGLARRPVVAYRIGGLAETIVNDKTGILVPHLNMRAFINALIELANDPRRRRKLGAAAAEHVLAQYDSTRLTKELLALWDEELSKV
ncbi:MAG: glycosyltransferase family 4 protein [Zavarzinia sp.]|nr:glycosyltransferase family 4 protein [Zavarzinia sp.]